MKHNIIRQSMTSAGTEKQGFVVLKPKTQTFKKGQQELKVFGNATQARRSSVASKKATPTETVRHAVTNDQIHSYKFP